MDYKLKVNASYQVSEEWYVDYTSVRGMLIGQLTQQHREAQPLREPFLLYQEHGRIQRFKMILNTRDPRCHRDRNNVRRVR